MSTRVFYGGHNLYTSLDWRRHPAAPLELGENGEFIDTRPIFEEVQPPGLVPGGIFVDEEDEFRIAYRVVSKINVAEGWGTAEFWTRRYHIDMKLLAEWVGRGWFDAAIEPASPTRRFRCRDEHRVLSHLKELIALQVPETRPAKLGKRSSKARST